MTLTKTRRDQGLEALLQEHPEELKSWVTEAPLKLVAAILIDIGDKAKKGAIIEKIPRGLFDGSVKADPWWERVRPAIAESTKYFEVTKDGKVSFRRSCHVDDIPTESLRPKPVKAKAKRGATVTDWKKWLQSDTPEPPPGRWPTKPVSNALAKWPAKQIDQVMARIMWGAEGFLKAGGNSSQAAAGWLEAVSSASLRWRECTWSDSHIYLAEKTGTTLAYLARVAGYTKELEGWLLLTGVLVGSPNGWRRGFAAGLWEAFQDSSDKVRGLLKASADRLGSQGQAAFIREIALAAFDRNDSDQIHPQLDHLLDILSQEYRTQVIRELIVRSFAGTPKSKILDYVANSRHAVESNDPDKRLDMLILAAISLTGGQGHVADQASRELFHAFMSSNRGGVAVQALLKDMRVSISGELESQRQSYEKQLERERHEQDRLRQQIHTLNVQSATKREESRLDIRRDMLLVVGEAIQLMYRQRSNPEVALRDLEAGLVLALGAGDAQLIEIAGSSVEYNPFLHKLDGEVADGTPVRVSAPGVIVPSSRLGDAVLLKARVSQISGG